MFGAHTLMVNPTVVAAIAATCVGFAAFWSNPRRGMNRAFFSGSLHVSIWLISLYFALSVGNGLPWLRLSCAIGGLMPLHIFIVQQTISARLSSSVGPWLRAHRIWIAISLVLLVVPLTALFIPANSTGEHRIHGPGYYVYI